MKSKGLCRRRIIIDFLSAMSRENKRSEDYEKVPLLKAKLGGVKNRGFAYDNYNYRAFC